MILTAEQNLRIALLYEKAAADRLGVPPQQRTAFARKAKWFRMKARIRAKKEAVSAPAEQRMNGTARLDEACLDEAWLEQARVNGAAPRPNGSHPNETRPNGASPNGSRPNGTRPNGASPDEARLDEARPDEARLGDPKKRPRRYRSIAERIAAARAAQS